MTWTANVWQRIQRLLFRERYSQQLDKELDFHIDQQIAENIANGMTPDEARHAAMRTFGNSTLVQEDSHAAWGWLWLEQLGQDIRYAFRQLRKTPGFTTTAIVTLAFGIGANAAIFTLVNAVMMKNLPVADPKMLIFHRNLSTPEEERARI